MLEITVPGTELYDEVNNVFITTKPCTLRLEHSLVSISKWESKWKKPFLDPKTKSQEESIDYIKCMTLNQNVDPNVYLGITAEQMETINEYVSDNKTATWFRDSDKKSPNRNVVTSELVYYWMASYQIPFETQKWHFSRLMTLIHIFNVKNQEPKKMSKNEILARNKALNEARRAKLHTKG